MSRQYYSQRKHGPTALKFEQFRKLFYAAFERMYSELYFAEELGGQIQMQWRPGSVGDVSADILLRLHKEDMWPIEDYLTRYSEEDVFDMIEYLYDRASCTVFEEGIFDGPRFTGEFQKEAGQKTFLERFSPMLAEYSQGYELTTEGKVLVAGVPGLKEVFDADLPTEDRRVTERVNRAVGIYRDRHSDGDARRLAVRELADICELLRPQIKRSMLTKDEAGLFDIANNYALRHLNDTQKDDYPPEWLSWMFYLYLSTIHLILRLSKRETSPPSDAPTG